MVFLVLKPNHGGQSPFPKDRRGGVYIISHTPQYNYFAKNKKKFQKKNFKKFFKKKLENLSKTFIFFAILLAYIRNFLYLCSRLKKTYMSKLLKLDIPIYRETLFLHIGSSKELVATLKKLGVPECKAKGDVDDEFVLGKFNHFVDEGVFIIHLPKIPVSIADYGVVVHEIQHFVFKLLTFRGLAHTDESDEAFSYLMEFVFCEIDSWLNSCRDDSKPKPSKKR